MQIGHAGYQTGVEFSAESKFETEILFTVSVTVLELALPSGMDQNNTGSSKRKNAYEFGFSGKFYPCLIPSMPYLQ